MISVKQFKQWRAGMDGMKPFTIMMKDREVMKVDFDALQY